MLVVDVVCVVCVVDVVGVVGIFAFIHFYSLMKQDCDNPFTTRRRGSLLAGLGQEGGGRMVLVDNR